MFSKRREKAVNGSGVGPALARPTVAGRQGEGRPPAVLARTPPAPAEREASAGVQCHEVVGTIPHEIVRRSKQERRKKVKAMTWKVVLLLSGVFLAVLQGEGWITPAMAGFSSGKVEVLAVPSGPVGAVAVDPREDRVLYLGGAEGLFRSTDGGESWSFLSRELLYPHVLLVDPFDSAVLYAARRDLPTFLPLTGVYRSDDGGRTWKRFTAGLGEERIFSLAVDPFHKGVLYAGSWAGRVYRTEDGGKRWERSSAEAVRQCPRCPTGPIVQLLVSPVDGALYAVASDSGTFRSTDGGRTWEGIIGDGGRLAVDLERGALYLAGRRLWRSTDGGKTWDDLSAGLPYDPRTRTYAIFWVGVNSEPWVIYTRYHYSTDGGVTWEALKVGVGFVPRLLVPGEQPTIYGSFNGRAGRYREAELGVP